MAKQTTKTPNNNKTASSTKSGKITNVKITNVVKTQKTVVPVTQKQQKSLKNSSNAVGKVGEEVVAKNLKSSGYKNVRIDTKGAGATDVEAFGKRGSKGINTQVKATATKKTAPNASPEERKKLLERAEKEGKKAVVSRVKIDTQRRKAEITSEFLNDNNKIKRKKR